MLKYVIYVVAPAVMALPAYAELRSLSDSQLSEATGDGLGLVLEDFQFSTDGASMTITGIENSNNEEITASVDGFYIMGEGSVYGTQPRDAQIGTYYHPWVIQSVRGNSAPEFSQIGDDVALLELKTDSYTNPLQNSSLFSVYSRYQGCIWGHDGCGSQPGDTPFTAVDEIDNQIAGYQADVDALNALYSGVYAGGASSYLINESEVVQSPGGVVYEQQRVIEEKQVILAEAIRTYEAENPGEYASAKTIAGNELTEASQLYQLTDKSVNLGEKYDCGFFGTSCSTEERNYNDQIDDWEDAKNDVADIEKNWEAENLELAEANRDLGDILTKEEYTDESGRTLGERIADADKYQVLCGESATDDSCSDGLISVRTGERDDINDIALALNRGQQRRAGLDVGARLSFEVINENKNTGEISRVKDYLSFEMKGLYVDNSYLRLWSRPDKDTGLAKLNGELSLRFFAKQFVISSCGVECELKPGDSDAVIEDKLALKDSTALKLNNYLYDLNLGYGDVQPLTFDVSSDGHFVFELGFPDFETTGQARTKENVQAFFNDYYDNAPKSNFIIGQVQLGAVPETGPNYGDLGGVRAVGLRAQYLRIESYDIN